MGVALSFAGTILGATSLLLASRTVWAAATACFGAATGIVLHLRFAVRTTTTTTPSYATAWTVAGGIGAALWGGPFLTRWVQQGLSLEPIVEEGGDDDELNNTSYEYMGVFLLTGIYGVAGAVCTAMVDFGDAAHIAAAMHERRVDTLELYAAVLTDHAFVFPMLFSALVWSVLFLLVGMAQALSSAAAEDVLSNSTHSLLITELHLACLYFPGALMAGCCCSRCLGYRLTCGLSVILNSAAVVLLFLAGDESAVLLAGDESATLVFQIVGMACLGLGWGFGFLGATEWLAQTSIPGMADVQVQCAHDFVSFLLVSIALTAASLTVEDVNDVSSDWSQWKIVHGVAAVLLLLAFLLVVGDCLWKPDHVQKKQAKGKITHTKRSRGGNNTMVIDSNHAVVNQIRAFDGQQKKQKRVPSPYPIKETNHRRQALDENGKANTKRRTDRQVLHKGTASYDHEDEEDNIVRLRPLEDSEVQKAIEDDIRQRNMMGIALADESFDSDSVYTNTDNDDDTLPPPPPPLDGDYDEEQEWSTAILHKPSYMTGSTAEESRETEEYHHPQDEVMVAHRY